MASSRPFLQLLRPPNLFTVPGDPLCGALLASGGVWSWKIAPCIAVSLAAYCAGLVTNDLADYSEDLRDRPSRPLPSGAISRGGATRLALLFGSAALAAASTVNPMLLALTVLLLGEIVWYNFIAKRSPVIGPIAMGVCRGLSVLIGAAAIVPLHASAYALQTTPGQPSTLIFTHPPSPLHAALLPAAVITVYIAIVTALARRETRDPLMPGRIGALIRGLLFIQAGFCAMAGGCGWAAAVVLIALWPVSRAVGAHFYAS